MQGTDGIDAITRRVDRQIEVSERAVNRQKLSLVLEIEKKAQIANAVCWLIMVFAVFQLAMLLIAALRSLALPDMVEPS